ncbi:SIMPL domain-containing protein [Acuticoccus kandeliae]|uniref:SIMPL domain-containing protein n=1 Tax=Acuticoccus kandeliae TaxID=2073160 RepID=UPI001300B624|nr:SIMPL domain-containing protein [Acuticoccus kandeliae]
MLRVVTAAMLVALAIAPVNAAEMRLLTVTGDGTAAAAPDQATITIGVESVAVSAAEALAANTREATAIIDAIKAAGVADADIQTSNISVQPRFTDRSYADGGSEVSGYQVSNQLTITVRALDGLGALLDSAVSAGANQIFGISFGFQDDTAITDEAREAAVADALRKGALYAKAAGVTLGAITGISEINIGPSPMPMAMQRMQASVPVEAGQQSVAATVSVTWSLVD